MVPNADHRRLISVQLMTPLVVIATAVLGAAADATGLWPTGEERAQAQMVGVFTGEFVNGAPVYRLPPVIVVASRKAEWAKLEREEHSTRARQARAKAAARHPA